MRARTVQSAITMHIAAVALLATAGADAAVNERSESPYAKDDGTWISIRGTVDGVRPDNFTLDYGAGTIIVEMDDGDRDADAYKLMRGDEVTVSGRIDDDFFETTSIEAASVYVANLSTTFFASAADDETPAYVADMAMTPVVVSGVIVRGKVTEVSGDEFVVDTGLRKVRVDVDSMPYDPLDDEGYQKIAKGDLVRVTGRIDNDLFEGRELMAESVITLSDRNRS